MPHSSEIETPFFSPSQRVSMQVPFPPPPRRHAPVHPGQRVEHIVRALLMEEDSLGEIVNDFTASCDLLACCPVVSSVVSSFFTSPR